MSSFAPFDDARTLLQTANLVPSGNIEFANEPFVQPDGINWLSVDAYSHVLNPIDLGANNWAERGTIIVYCCAPAGDGSDSLRMLAKAVANVFRTASLIPRNPYYHNASIGSGGMSDGGKYYVLPVSVEFVYEDAAI